MSHITNLILDRLAAHLKTEMQEKIDPADLSYVDVIKKGLLQFDKTRKNVSIGLEGGDHEDPNYLDGIVTVRQRSTIHNIGWETVAREIGGGEAWYRRGVARIECYFIRERLEEAVAFDKAYEVLGRLTRSLQTANLTGLVDSHGERAFHLFVYANTFFQSGGPPKSYIFRGKVLWQVETERP